MLSIFITFSFRGCWPAGAGIPGQERSPVTARSGLTPQVGMLALDFNIWYFPKGRDNALGLPDQLWICLMKPPLCAATLTVSCTAAVYAARHNQRIFNFGLHTGETRGQREWRHFQKVFSREFGIELPGESQLSFTQKDNLRVRISTASFSPSR